MFPIAFYFLPPMIDSTEEVLVSLRKTTTQVP